MEREEGRVLEIGPGNMAHSLIFHTNQLQRTGAAPEFPPTAFPAETPFRAPLFAIDEAVAAAAEAAPEGDSSWARRTAWLPTSQANAMVKSRRPVRTKDHSTCVCVGGVFTQCGGGFRVSRARKEGALGLLEGQAASKRAQRGRPHPHISTNRDTEHPPTIKGP